MPADVFFISYRETNCEQNWARVLELHPNAIRLHGVTGIDVVHNICDSICNASHFWTVDGDNYLTQELRWRDDEPCDLIMFKAIDPVHNNLTLLGGVKLWRKGSITHKTMAKGDFCLNATNTKTVIERAWSETRYNSSPYDAWKTAFRHCVKLSSVIFRSRPNAKNLDTYLEQWRSCGQLDTLNSEWCYRGYLDAIDYVKIWDNNLPELYRINDYSWLQNFYNQKYNEKN